MQDDVKIYGSKTFESEGTRQIGKEVASRLCCPTFALSLIDTRFTFVASPVMLVLYRKYYLHPSFSDIIPTCMDQDLIIAVTIFQNSSVLYMIICSCKIPPTDKTP